VAFKYRAESSASLSYEVGLLHDLLAATTTEPRYHFPQTMKDGLSASLYMSIIMWRVKGELKYTFLANPSCCMTFDGLDASEPDLLTEQL
jgi:hypothetical protein